MILGVVCIPFGWDHNRKGIKINIAEKTPGISMNDITDDKLIDKLFGTSDVDRIDVTINKY